jgi:hypothetical protein
LPTISTLWLIWQAKKRKWIHFCRFPIHPPQNLVWILVQFIHNGGGWYWPANTQKICKINKSKIYIYVNSWLSVAVVFTTFWIQSNLRQYRSHSNFYVFSLYVNQNYFWQQRRTCQWVLKEKIMVWGIFGELWQFSKLIYFLFILDHIVRPWFLNFVMTPLLYIFRVT